MTPDECLARLGAVVRYLTIPQRVTAVRLVEEMAAQVASMRASELHAEQVRMRAVEEETLSGANLARRTREP